MKQENSGLCVRCGLCCKRTPCALALYLGHTPNDSPCKYLRVADHEGLIYSCALIDDEQNQIKKLCAKKLILSGDGCTHKFGPDIRHVKRLTYYGALMFRDKNQNNEAFFSYEKKQFEATIKAHDRVKELGYILETIQDTYLPLYRGDIVLYQGEKYKVINPLFGDNLDFYGYWELAQWIEKENRFSFVTIDAKESEISFL